MQGPSSRRMPLEELLAALPALGPAARDEVWRALVRRVRDGEGVWVVAAAGLALPGLRSARARLRTGAPAGGAADLEAELLTGFLAEIQVIDLDEPVVWGRLRAAAYRAGQRWRYAVQRDFH